MGTVLYRFYQVSVQEGSIDLLQALEGLLGQTPQQRHWHDHRDCFGFISESHTYSNVPTFVFAKLRMEDLPPIMGLDGSREDLDIRNDQGVGEECVLAYDTSCNVVAIQSNRQSFTHNKIAEYVNSFYRDMELKFIPIFSDDALEKISRMEILKKVSCRFASTTDLSFLEDYGMSAREKMAIQQLLESPYLELQFSVGRGGRNAELPSLCKRLVNAFSRAIQEGRNVEVQRMLVAGKENPESRTESIDMLAEQLHYKARAASDTRYFNIDQLCRLASQAIVDMRPTIRARHV